MKELSQRIILLILIILKSNSTMAMTNSFFGNELIQAVDSSDDQEVTRLIKLGQPIDIRGKFGITPLMRAAYKNNVSLVKQFISLGANADAADIGGATSLHIAVRNGNYEIVNLLLNEHVNVNAKDNDGWSPLMRACGKRNANIISSLLKNNADPFLLNRFNQSAITVAIVNNNDLALNEFVKFGIFNKISEIDKNNYQKLAEKKQNVNIVKILHDNFATVQVAAIEEKKIIPYNIVEEKMVNEPVIIVEDRNKNPITKSEKIITVSENEASKEEIISTKVASENIVKKPLEVKLAEIEAPKSLVIKEESKIAKNDYQSISQLKEEPKAKNEYVTVENMEEIKPIYNEYIEPKIISDGNNWIETKYLSLYDIQNKYNELSNNSMLDNLRLRIVKSLNDDNLAALQLGPIDSDNPNIENLCNLLGTSGECNLIQTISNNRYRNR